MKTVEKKFTYGEFVSFMERYEREKKKKSKVKSSIFKYVPIKQRKAEK